MGELTTDTDGEASLSVEIQAIPEIDVTFVSVFVNCDEVLTVATSDPLGVVKIADTLAVPLPLEEDAHITLAAFGEDRFPAGLPQFNPTQVPRVLTGAIFVDTNGDGVFSAPGGRVCDVRLSGP